MKLANFGLKETKTRRKILTLLENSKEPMTAEDIFKVLLEDEINLSTVYRTLNSFISRNLISKEIRQDGIAVYHYITSEHHHVLICTKCNKKIFLDDCPYQEIDRSIYEKTGFSIKHHNIELYGLCKDCQNKNDLN